MFWDLRTGRRFATCCRIAPQHRPIGVQVAAGQQPAALPGVRERWPFIEPTLRKAPIIKMVPVLGSLGCPYTCSFCIDAAVPYQAHGLRLSSMRICDSCWRS